MNIPNSTTTTTIKSRKPIRRLEDYDEYDVVHHIMEMDEDNINFTINVNNIIGNLGPKDFNQAIHAIETAMYILQRKGIPRYTFNICFLANKMLNSNQSDAYQLNRSEVFAFLYYIEKHLETIHLNTGNEGILTWSIRDDIFKNACENDTEYNEHQSSVVSADDPLIGHKVPEPQPPKSQKISSKSHTKKMTIKLKK